MVPVASVNRQEARKWAEQFDGALELQGVVGGAALRAYFLTKWRRQLGSVMAEVAPEALEKDKGVEKPVPVGEKWLIGFDPR